MEIIPAMDLIDGKCVRLTQGDFGRQTVYSSDPVDIARRFEQSGLTRLHMVDLDGARTGSPANLSVLEKVAAATGLVIDFGGGIMSDADAKMVFDCGAAMINVGGVAVKDAPTLVRWLREFGSDRILLAADVRERKVVVSGWQESTGIELLAFLSEWSKLGLKQAFVTDVACDGALNGPAVDLYDEISRALPGLTLIASGGVGSVEDLYRLRTVGCSGAIVGKSIYEGRITPEELNQFQNGC